MSLSYVNKIIFTKLIESLSKIFVFMIIMLLSLMSVIYIFFCQFSNNKSMVLKYQNHKAEKCCYVSYKIVNLNMIRTLKMTKMTSWNSFIAQSFSIINCWKFKGKIA